MVLHHYKWLTHVIELEAGGMFAPRCATCSLPYLIAEAVVFMDRFALASMTLGESEIHRIEGGA